MPASFDFGAIFAPGAHIDLFYPFALSKETDRWGNTLALVGRLKPDATLPRAQAEADILGNQISAEHPNQNDLHPKLTFAARARERTIASRALDSRVCGRCRHVDRLRESIQPDAGAHCGAAKGDGHTSRAGGRPQAADSPTADRESAADGLWGRAGSGAHVCATRGIAHLTAFNLPLLSSVHVDSGVLAFTVLIAVATGLLLGVAPAFAGFWSAAECFSRAARRERREGPCLAPRRVGRLRDCLRLRAAGRRGTLDSEFSTRAGRAVRLPARRAWRRYASTRTRSIRYTSTEEWLI